jgi:hypothetical protein
MKPNAPAAGTGSEIELLLCCARTCLDADRAERIRTFTREDLNWAFLFRTALRHKVMPLVYQSLNATCPETVPPATHDQFRSHLHTIALRNLFLTKELINLLKLLEANDIRAIPYKGPVLAASIYGNLALRHFSDLDILVCESDYCRTQDLLISQKYHLIKEFDCESTFLDISGRVYLDLHRALTPRQFPLSLDFNSLWKRLKPISIGGTTVLNLSPEDMLIILSVNIAKDGVGGKYNLAKICDIAELLRVAESMDWVGVMEKAGRLGCRRIVFVGLQLATQLLGTVLPKEVLRSMEADPAVCSLATHIREREFDETCKIPYNFFNWARLHSMFRERVRDKVFPYYERYIVSKITPVELDYAFVSLPASFSFLYYVVRPIRLAYKYGLRMLRHFREA